MAFLTLMKMTVVGYPPNISWLDNAIRMLLTATDHPIYGIMEISAHISKNQLWKLKIMLAAFPNPKNQKTKPSLPAVHFFGGGLSSGHVLAFSSSNKQPVTCGVKNLPMGHLALWKILRKGFIGVLSDIVPIGGGLLIFLEFSCGDGVMVSRGCAENTLFLWVCLCIFWR